MEEDRDGSPRKRLKWVCELPIGDNESAALLCEAGQRFHLGHRFQTIHHRCSATSVGGNREDSPPKFISQTLYNSQPYCTMKWGSYTVAVAGLPPGC